MSYFFATRDIARNLR